MIKRGKKDDLQRKQSTFDLIMKGCTPKQMANILGVGVSAIHYRIKRVLKERNATSVAELMAMEIERLQEENYILILQSKQ